MSVLPPPRPAPTREEMAAEYSMFISTWAAHCGAPKSVFVGQLNVLMQTVAAYKAGQVAAYVQAQGKEGRLNPYACRDIGEQVLRHCVWPDADNPAAKTAPPAPESEGA
jgi:hypothetical protein